MTRPKFEQRLYPYQAATVGDALAFCAEAAGLAPGVDRRRLYALPTGTGKGSIQCELLRRLGSRALIVTTRLEIIDGYLERYGLEPGSMSLGARIRAAEQLGIWTYGRLYSRVLRGSAPSADVLIIDEAHHWMDAGGRMSRLLSSVYLMSIVLGFTATPFRGTASGTQAFLAFWGGDYTEVLSIAQAVQLGVMAAPIFRVRGLVDDEQIEIVNGEVAARRVEEETRDRLAALADLIVEVAIEYPHPRIVTLPTRELVRQMGGLLQGLGHPWAAITQDTPARERQRAFAAARDEGASLLTVAVVSEGVDAPWLAVWIDARPTLSTVAWLQQLGRITRPKPVRPLYVGTNRNLERHAHRLSGVIPQTEVQCAQRAFAAPSKRAAMRVLALENFGRLKSFSLPGLHGGWMETYSLVHQGEEGRTDYAIALAPWLEEPMVAVRRSGWNPEKPGEWTSSRWEWGSLPTDGRELLTRTTRKAPLSPAQIAWWKRAARRVGLDPEAAERGDVDPRAFDVFAALASAVRPPERSRY